MKAQGFCPPPGTWRRQTRYSQLSSLAEGASPLIRRVTMTLRCGPAAVLFVTLVLAFAPLAATSAAAHPGHHHGVQQSRAQADEIRSMEPRVFKSEQTREHASAVSGDSLTKQNPDCACFGGCCVNGMSC